MRRRLLSPKIMTNSQPGKKPWVYIFSWFVKLFSLSIVKVDLVSEVLTMEPCHITFGGHNHRWEKRKTQHRQKIQPPNIAPKMRISQHS